jgi:hypothetical protein
MNKIFFAIAFSLISSHSFAAQPVCGKMQVAFMDGSLMVKIADFKSYANKQQNYKVLNPFGFEWTAGSCVCVSGDTSLDPEYEGDSLYMQVRVKSLVSHDPAGTSCLPRRAH